MTRWLTPRFLMVLLFLAAAGAPAQEAVVLVPEIRITPMDGRVCAPGVSATVAELGAFDLAPEGTLRATAAPGERLLWQWVLPGRDWRVETAHPDDVHLALFQAGVIKPDPTAGEPLPDILVPLRGGPREWDLTRDPVVFPEDARYTVLWIEAGPAGNHGAGTAEVALTARGAAGEARLRIELAVGETPLGPLPLILDFNEYGDKYLRPFAKTLPEAALAGVERELFHAARAHGGLINALPYDSQKGDPRRGMTPVRINDDPLDPRFDWIAFDARYGPYLDGSGYPDGRPIAHFYLPFNPDWPAPFALYESDRERYEAIWAATAREFVRHFREKGWTETVFQVYCNQKPRPGNDIPWNLDEPKGRDDYRALRYYADLTHRVFAGADPVQVRFRIDISHFYCDAHRGQMDKDFRVNGGDDILAPVDIWVISIHSLADAVAVRAARELASQGKGLFVYGDTPRIDDPATAVFHRIYRAWQSGVDGFMIWKSFSRDLNGDASEDFIWYALDIGGRTGIYPSIRLKLAYRALQDAARWSAAGIDPDRLPGDLADLLEAYAYGDLETVARWRQNAHPIK